VQLDAGGNTSLTFRLERNDLAYLDENSNRWVVAPGRYAVSVGTSSIDLDHRATFDVGS
jgi:Fibronectin type III-like domain